VEERGGGEMSNPTLRRRIAALVVAAFLALLGATVATAAVAGSADAQLPTGKDDPTLPNG
jgi:hypothetical protein